MVWLWLHPKKKHTNATVTLGKTVVDELFPSKWFL